MAEETETTQPEKEKATFKIFGSVDLDTKGEVKSTYPAWYFDHLKDELRNDIDRVENQIQLDRIPRSELAVTKERLQQKKAKMKELENATIELRGKLKDRVLKVREEIGEKISESLFTRSDMMKGLADAHEEVRRMTEPCIEVRGDANTFARACNVKVIKGKVSRDGAAKIWKIAGKAIGDGLPTNVEYLRRDG